MNRVSFLAADNVGNPAVNISIFAAFVVITLFIVIRIATHVFHLLKRPGATIGVFLMGYSLARIFVENFREPDAQMPDFPLGLTMGMMLSMPMFALGLWLLLRTRMKSAPAKTGPA